MTARKPYPLGVEKRCYAVTALDFDPPIVEIVHAGTAGRARMSVARRAYDAGWYDSLFAACRRMRVTVVRAAEKREEGEGR